jgi:hypothetical protein
MTELTAQMARRCWDGWVPGLVLYAGEGGKEGVGRKQCVVDVTMSLAIQELLNRTSRWQLEDNTPQCGRTGRAE